LDHLLQQLPQVHAHAAVSFTTSSRVVTPRLSFTMPSMRSVSMPSFTACSRSSSVEPPFSTMRRSALVIAITSYNPCRPLYPVPPQVSHPWPLKNVRCFASASGMPRACSSSSEYLCSALQLEQTRRTRRCATIRFTALATLNGSIPMSIIRVTVDGASFVCSVDSTRWPVNAALMAIDPVSRSRISPTMMMFGSCRRNALRAAANVMPTSLRTSTWLMPSKLYSTGSSAVMMFTSIWLIRDRAEYSVVVLPDPVGPVTSTMP